MNIDTIHSVRIAVDYGKSLQEMIATAGYDSAHGDITPKHFPLVGKGVVQFEPNIFHFGKAMSSKGAVLGITTESPQNPWQPAPIEALIAYGVENPPGKQAPIIALGSIPEIDGRHWVPCLDRTFGGHYLDLALSGINWSGDCRFLAVRKLS